MAFRAKGKPFSQFFEVQSGLEVIQLFSCSTPLNLKSIRLIIVKMPTIVGILTSIRRINTISKSFKARKGIIFQHLSFFQMGYYIMLS